MRALIFDKEKIYEYQQNREPYLMIDYASEVIPGKSAKGYKDFNSDEWFFKVHWKNDPNVPGMLQTESLVQMSALSILSLPGNKGKVVYLVSANNLKFRKKVVPGDRLLLQTELISWRRGFGKAQGTGYVKDKMACSVEFEFVMPSILSGFSVQS